MNESSLRAPVALVLLLSALLLATPAAVLSAQDGPEAGQPQTTPQAAAPPPPDGFRSIRLGMELDTVKRLLQEEPLFAYRGDPDVSLLAQPQQTLIECAGTSYIRRGFFQFHDRRLYIMTLALEPARLDYYTMYSTLKEKYGDPTRLDPSGAVWEFEGLRLSLERPLSVKYIDTGVFRRLQDEAQVGEDLRALAKDRFLEQF